MRLVHEFRLALRQIVRQPAFSALVVFTLALGLGANLAIFALVHAVVLEPLPYPQSDRLVKIWDVNVAKDYDKALVSLPRFADWQHQARAFDSLSAYYLESVVWLGGETPERLAGIRASSDFWRVFRTDAALGRVFAAPDDLASRRLVAVLSHALWRQRFGADPSIVGRPLRLADGVYTVIGVMPLSFRYPADAEVWLTLPAPFEKSDNSWRGGRFLHVVGRLASGQTPDSARAELKTITAALQRQFPKSDGGWEVDLSTLQDQVVGRPVRQALLLLWAAVGLLLALACANVANLLLTRGLSRRRDLAVRLALGASRLRLARQLLVETAAFTLVGGACGLALAAGGTQLLRLILTDTIPRADALGIDATVVGFALLLSFVTAAAAALGPVMTMASDRNGAGLRSSDRQVGSRSLRPGRLLMAAQVALALILLVAAGLLLQTLRRLEKVDLGFRAENVLTFQVPLPWARTEPEALRLFYTEAARRIGEIGGVSDVGLVSFLPFAAGSLPQEFRVEGAAGGDHGDRHLAEGRIVHGEYFQAMGVPLLAGRAFREQDDMAAEKVVMVSDAFVRRFLRGRNPVGTRLVLQNGPVEVVGVVGDVLVRDVTESSTALIYFTLQQSYWPNMAFAVRTKGSPEAMTGAIRRAIRDVDPTRAVTGVKTMDERVAAVYARPRLNASLAVAFAGLALVLAAFGIYAVVSFAVASRRREIGLRIALGATRTQVLTDVLSGSLSTTVAGALIGSALALAAGGLIRSILFGVSPFDTATFAIVWLVLLFVSGLSSYLPARQAAATDPARTLAE